MWGSNTNTITFQCKNILIQMHYDAFQIHFRILFQILKIYFMIHYYIRKQEQIMWRGPSKAASARNRVIANYITVATDSEIVTLSKEVKAIMLCLLGQ